MFGVGTGEILMILLIAVLVVGPERMVEFARQMGQMVAKFRSLTDDATQEFREAFSLEPGDEDASEKAEAPVASADAAQTPAEGGSPAEAEVLEPSVEAAPVVEEEEPEALPAILTAELVDGEIEVQARVAQENLDEEPELLSPGEMEPIPLEIAMLVPEEEDVEPTEIPAVELMTETDDAVPEPKGGE